MVLTFKPHREYHIAGKFGSFGSIPFNRQNFYHMHIRMAIPYHTAKFNTINNWGQTTMLLTTNISSYMVSGKLLSVHHVEKLEISSELIKYWFKNPKGGRLHNHN